jgi:hypothetical protein
LDTPGGGPLAGGSEGAKPPTLPLVATPGCARILS